MKPQIKIGAINYSVVLVEDLEDGEGNRLDGNIVYGLCQIRLDSKLSEQAQLQVAWHEAIHAILSHAGINRHNDNLIDALAYGVMDVIRNNPWMAQPVEDKELI